MQQKCYVVLGCSICSTLAHLDDRDHLQKKHFATKPFFTPFATGLPIWMDHLQKKLFYGAVLFATSRPHPDDLKKVNCHVGPPSLLKTSPS